MNILIILYLSMFINLSQCYHTKKFYNEKIGSNTFDEERNNIISKSTKFDFYNVGSNYDNISNNHSSNKQNIPSTSNWSASSFNHTIKWIKNGVMSALSNISPNDYNCKTVFGNKWNEVSDKLGQVFAKNGYTLCFRDTPGNGNCLFASISYLITAISKKIKIKVLEPSYGCSDKYKENISAIIKEHKGLSPECLKSLAAMDFIGVDFEDDNELASFNVDSFIDKLEVYKVAYVGSNGDSIEIDSIINRLKIAPYDKNAYQTLYHEFSDYNTPKHWGNESDIAAFEKLFNVKFIICDDNSGEIFVVPTNVNNPRYIILLHFSKNLEFYHYSAAAMFHSKRTYLGLKPKKRYWHKSNNLPDFLKIYFNNV